MIPTRFIQELGRQFRLDLRDDEVRRKAQREEALSIVQESANAGQYSGSGEETPEKCDQVSAGELLIGSGQKRRTWIEGPLTDKALVRKEKKEMGISNEEPQ